ncbi:MAG: site-2 protease family protein [Anaerolineales bacterium]|nr:site-2 protease family protein [Anaerolineales bacterium]
MEIFGNILDWAVAFFLFGLLLFIHETGHFLMCRLTGVKVEEFGFGFPPKLAKLFSWQGTDITLNWIPFGAFVRPLGEDDPAVAGGLAAASKRVRTLVLLGGVLFNGLAAITAYTISFKIAYPDSVAVYSVTPETPSAQSGLLPGDVIVSVDGIAVSNSKELTDYIYANRGEEVALHISRDGGALDILVTPRTAADTPEGQGPTGMTLSQRFSGNHSLGEAFQEGLLTIRDQLQLFLQLPGMILRGGFNASTDRPVGPLGILDVTEQIVGSARENNQWVIILNWIGMINLALAVGNILPIPALDGGRLVFILLEAVRGKRVDPEKERMVHGYTMLVLIALMLFITYLDVFFPVLPR